MDEFLQEGEATMTKDELLGHMRTNKQSVVETNTNSYG